MKIEMDGYRHRIMDGLLENLMISLWNRLMIIMMLSLKKT